MSAHRRHCWHVEGRTYYPDGRVVYALVCCQCGVAVARRIRPAAHGPHGRDLSPLLERIA